MRKYFVFAASVLIVSSLQSPMQSQEKPAAKLDFTKTVRVEKPTSNLLARESAAVTNTANITGTFANPKIQPGKVSWHSTWKAACDAAAKSGKPVLLFQMMGKLDDQFC